MRRVLVAVVAAATIASTPARALAMCNAVPTATRGFASTTGEVDRPFASPGRHVRLMIGACRPDGTVFPPEGTEIEVRFRPPDGPPATLAIPPADVVSVMPTEIVFVFPDSAAVLGALRTGPAEIVARANGIELVRIDALGTRTDACQLAPSATFPGFTALPPANRFHDVAGAGGGARVRATIDVAGNLLIPWDWNDVAPAGRGFDPVARLVRAGESSLEAFPSPDPRSGTGIVLPNAAYLSAHTLTGDVLPPLLEIGPPSGAGRFPGSTIAGSVDSLDGLLRIGRRLGDDPRTEIFDLHTRLENAVGAIVIDGAYASEDPVIDLRSVRASEHVTVAEEATLGRSRSGALLLYDDRSGRFGRIAPDAGAPPLARRVGVSDEVAAFYDGVADAERPTLSVVPIAKLADGSTVQDVSPDAIIATGLFGSSGDGAEPVVGLRIVGGFAGADRDPSVFEITSGTVSDGRPIGANLIETPLGIANRRQGDRFATFPGALAPLGPGRPGHAFAAGDRAVFLVCDGPCANLDDTRRDEILMLLDDDGSLRELDRNAGVPFVFTGALVGLRAYEDGSYGAGSTGAHDFDGDGATSGIFLRIYDLARDRPMLPHGIDGRPVPVAEKLERIAATAHVLSLPVDEAAAGPLNCDDDADDRVLVLVNGFTGATYDTRQPVAAGSDVTTARGLTTFLQSEDAFGRPLGSGFLNVVRDSDGDELPDPYDDCPLTRNLDQADADHDGVGNACEATCDGVGCDPGATKHDAAHRRCLGEATRGTKTLLAAALGAYQAGEDPTGSSPVRAATTDLRQHLARCAPDVLADLGLCVGTVDALVAPKPPDGCLVRAVSAAVQAMVDVEPAGEDACTDGVRHAMASYAVARHRMVARCRDEALRRVGMEGVADAVAGCSVDPVAGPKLAALGRRARRRIGRACSAADIARLAVCGGVAYPTLATLIDEGGTGGCLVTSHRFAVDDAMRAASGFAGGPAGGASAAPCEPRPRPSPTTTPAPNTLTVRVVSSGTDGRPPTFDLGASGFFHGLPAFEGAGFSAHLDCPPDPTACAFESGASDDPFGGPVP